MNDSQQIRIGMIGAGAIARQRHLPGLKEIPGVKLEAVANRTMASTEQAAKEYGFAKTYEHWQQVADDPDVDAVFICTQPYTHADMTLYALAQGKHVFCQARMAMDLEDALRMKAADDETDLTTMLCPPPQYMSVEPTVLQLLQSGAIGEVRHIDLSHSTNMFLDPATELHWRQRADLQGINILDVGIMAEVLQKWFGPVASLSALGQTWTPTRPADADGKTAVELPDSITFIGELNSGASLTCLFSGAVKGGEPHMIIYGSEGTLTCSAQDPIVRLNTGRGEQDIAIEPENTGRWTVERDFIEAVRTGRKGDPSFAAGVQYMAVSQAVWDSVQSGGKHIEVIQFNE